MESLSLTGGIQITNGIDGIAMFHIIYNYKTTITRIYCYSIGGLRPKTITLISPFFDHLKNSMQTGGEFKKSKEIVFLAEFG
jgi:hypothetical protein